MKLALIIILAVLFNVIVANENKKRSALKEIKKAFERDSELPHEIYAKRDAAISGRPFYPPYNNQYQCELCCNGKRLNGQFPYSASCCGDTVIDSNTALCCANKSVSFPPSQNYYQWQCCGNNGVYNTTSQLCCGNTALDKGVLEQCCGSIKYNVSLNICCGDSVLPIPSYTAWSCCGNQAYDTTAKQCNNGNLNDIQQGVQNYQCGSQTINFVNQICCSEKPVNRVDNYTLCCGSQGYQSNQQLCCESTIYTGIAASQSCCGNQQIDVTTQKCCNNVIVALPTGKDCSSLSCCGTKLYNYSDQTSLCCNDQLNAISPATNAPPSSGVALPDVSGISLPYISYPYPNNYQCCGSQSYNPQTDTCCSQDSNSKVVSGPNAICCGVDTYDSSKNTCCNNTLYLVGTVPLDTCCCPNGGCNNYFPYYDISIFAK